MSPVGRVEEVVNAAGVCVPTPVCVKVWLNAALYVPVVTAGFVTVIVWQATTRLYVAPVPVQPFESVTVATIGKVPFCPGVPERTPAVDRVSPLGSVDAVVKAAGVCVPTPDCVKVWLNGASTVPVVVPGFVTVIVWQAMTSVYVAPVPVQPLESVTLTTIGKLPFCPGVPERTPAADEREPGSEASTWS